jgi:hypothetical protein
MDLAPKIIEALEAELRRQTASGKLRVGERNEDEITLEGRVRLDELAMAVAGAVAGGP